VIGNKGGVVEPFFILTEKDFRRWVKDAVKEYFAETVRVEATATQTETILYNRKEIAAFLRISLVTLTEWKKHGLPSHKQGGRIYFDKQEVLAYIKEKKMRQCGMGSKLRHLKQDIS
jgi:hypothetical protein